jgi:flagellar biosynthesis/type III secretory pathway M-ring protein FliF/YscJ
VIIGLVVAAVVALVAIVLIAFFRAQAREQVLAARADTARLQAVLDDVKDIAWSNREIAPDLSTIVIDTIRTGEERLGRRELPK